MSSDEIDTRTKILEATWRLMEQRQGIGVRMGDIASEAGVSRQAIYLHFDSRTRLMCETTQYVDKVAGLDDQLEKLQTAENGTTMLRMYVDIWGNHLPKIHGIAKALIAARETDDAAATAWDECMACLRDGCEQIITTLIDEDNLIHNWKHKDASEMMWTILSYQTWEQLTVDCHWSHDQYIKSTIHVLVNTFVK